MKAGGAYLEKVSVFSIFWENGQSPLHAAAGGERAYLGYFPHSDPSGYCRQSLCRRWL